MSRHRLLLISYTQEGEQVPANKGFKGRYDLFTVWLVPGMTVILASAGSWFGTNLSVLANTGGGRIWLAAWGIVTGCYYCFYTLYLFRLGGYRNPAGRRLVLGAGGFLGTAVLLPYAPETLPAVSAIHVLLAFFSPLLLALALAGFVDWLRRCLPDFFEAAWKIFWRLIALCLAILAGAGFITSFLEIFVVLSLCWFLRYLETLLRRKNLIGFPSDL